jgi:hypothetical protein
MVYKISLSFAITLALSFLFVVTTAFAQVDPEKALIGKWAGQTEGGKNRERNLVINSVKATGSGEWIGYANDGKTEVSISKKDNEIYLEYFGAGGVKNSYHLKMVGDNKLEGTVDIYQGRRTERAGITFEKVKAGDVK